MKWKTTEEMAGTDTKKRNEDHYFNTYMKRGIELANVQPNEKILDFGCGKKLMKKHLIKEQKDKYKGYDIIPELTDIKDYRKYKPDIIFTFHTLEHLTKEQLKEFIEYCKKIEPRKIIIGLPLESIISNIMAILTRTYYRRGMIHLLKHEYINQEFQKEFKNIEIETIWFMTIISTWEKTLA